MEETVQVIDEINEVVGQLAVDLTQSLRWNPDTNSIYIDLEGGNLDWYLEPLVNLIKDLPKE